MRLGRAGRRELDSNHSITVPSEPRNAPELLARCNVEFRVDRNFIKARIAFDGIRQEPWPGVSIRVLCPRYILPYLRRTLEI